MMIEHRYSVRVTRLGSDVDSERLEIQSVGDIVRRLTQSLSNVLQPTGNNHLSERQFPRCHNLGFRPAPRLQMLNKIKAYPWVSRGPFRRIPIGGDPRIGRRQAVGFQGLGAKQFYVWSYLEPAIWLVVTGEPRSLQAQPSPCADREGSPSRFTFYVTQDARS